MPENARVRHILLLRHGQTDANAANVIQGHQPVPLNALGHAQARRLAGRVREYSPRIDALVSSDLERAVQTAAPIAAACGVPVRYDSAWRERFFGPLEGRAMSHDEIWRIVTGETEPPGAESSADFFARTRSALADLLHRYPAGATIAVVTHGGPIRSVLRTFIDGGLPLAPDHPRPELVPIANCSLMHLTHASTPPGGHWTIACLNDVSHLDEETARDAG